MSWGFSIAHGQITHVIDPSNFWIAIGTALELKAYANYASELNTYYNNNSENFQVHINSLEKGSEVVVFSQTVWNRAKIARINKHTVDVFYIDLGYTEIVDVNQVRFIASELFNYLPPKVRRMGLAGIKPLSNSWTSRATNYFTRLVLHMDLLVSIVEIDGSQSCGWILIFIQSRDETWISVTQKMLEDEMGESTGQHFVKILSKDLVLSMKEFENVCPLESAQVIHFPQENNERKEIESGDRNESTDKKIPIHVPTQDLQVLEQTKALTVADIRNGKSKNKVYRQEAPERKESETDIFDWGNTDLYVGVPDVFSDVHDISKQIAQTFQSDSVGSEVDIFPYRKPKVDDQQDITSETKPPTLDTKPLTLETEPLTLETEPLTLETDPLTLETKSQEPMDQNECHFNSQDEVQAEEECQPLSEEASYKIGKDIMLILQNENRDDKITVCQLVNDLIEPDMYVARDLLNVVIETLLESLVNTRVETEMALTVLDTYIDTELFKEVLLAVLKVLKNKYVKLPQSVRLKGRYSDFVQVLTTVFNHSVNWPKRFSKPVHEYTVNLLRLWIVFNKTGQQNYESSLSVELMYLDCVQSFLMNSGHLLLKLSPEHYYYIIEEIKGKLLHDLTNKSVKPLLLELILKYHCVSRPQRDIGTQTGAESEERSNINVGVGNTSEIYITSNPNLFMQIPGNKEMNFNPDAPECKGSNVYSSVSSDSCNQDIVLSPREDRNTIKASDCSKGLARDTPRLKYTAAELKELNPLKSSHAQNIVYTQPEEMLHLINSKDQRKICNEVNKQEETETFTKTDGFLYKKPVLDWKQDSSQKMLHLIDSQLIDRQDQRKICNEVNKQEEIETFTKTDGSLYKIPVLDWKQDSSQKMLHLIDSQLIDRQDQRKICNETKKQEESFTKSNDSLYRKPVLDLQQESCRKMLHLINSQLIPDRKDQRKISYEVNKQEEAESFKKTDGSLSRKSVLDMKQETSQKMMNDSRDKEKAKLLAKIAEPHSWKEHHSDFSQGAISPEQVACVRESTISGKSTLWRIAEDFMSSPSEIKPHSSSSGDWNSCESSQEGDSHRKGPKKAAQKKKKPKFQPLKQFLTAQVEDNVKEDETAIGDTEDDLLSAEAIAFYEELENAKNLMDGGKIIHSSTLGAVSVSKRRSRFSDWEKPLSSTPHSLWCPEQWRCTRCNSKEHNVYDCPEKDGYDSKYMLI